MPYNVSISKVMAGKVQDDDIIDYDLDRPPFGRYWWFWVPRFNSNGGRFSRHECVDVSINWLCFSISLTFWYGNA